MPFRCLNALVNLMNLSELRPKSQNAKVHRDWELRFEGAATRERMSARVRNRNTSGIFHKVSFSSFNFSSDFSYPSFRLTEFTAMKGNRET